MYFYSSNSNDIPKINNTYGDLNTLINYIIDGGNLLKVTKIAPYKDKQVKIYWDGSVAPFTKLQTIEVTGSLSKLYDKSYFINDVDFGDNSLICYNSTVDLSVDSDTSADIKMRSKPCGLIKKFGGVSEKRTVIKTKDGIEFRLDDRDFGSLLNPTVTTNNSWIKCARLSMSSEYDSLDHAVGRMFPYNSSRPNEEISCYGANYIGQSLITYNLSYTIKTSINSTNDAMTTTPFKIWANENFMYIQFSVSANINDQTNRTFMFGSFKSEIDGVNGIINTRKPPFETYNAGASYTSYNQSFSNWGSYIGYDSSQYTNPFSNGQDRTMYNLKLYNDGSDNTIDIYTFGSYTLGSGRPSSIGGTPYPNTVTGKVAFSDVILNINNITYGTMYDIKWINSNYQPEYDSLFEIENELYMSVGIKYSSSTDFRSNVLIKLDRA